MKEWQNDNETNLPLNLFLYAIRDRHIQPSVLKTYLGLKLYYPDHFIVDKFFTKDLAVTLNLTTKTLNKHIQTLIELNLIGFDVKCHVMYVRSKYKIPTDGESAKQLHTEKYHFKVLKDNLNHFTEYIIAAAIAYLIRKQKDYEYYKAALKNDGTLQALYKSSFQERAVPVTSIASFLNKSTSWVNKYKKKAKQLKLISVKKAFYKETFVEWRYRFAYLRSNEIPIGRARKKDGYLFLVEADLITSMIILKKRKKVHV